MPETDNKRIYRVDDGEMFWIVATSPEEALNTYEEWAGLDESVKYWSRVRDNIIPSPLSRQDDFSIRMDGEEVTMKVAEWVEGFDTPAIIASTMF